MHSKNHNGFTLIEVILSLAITGLVLTPVFVIYTTLSQRVTSASRKLDVLIEAKALLIEAHQKQEPDAQEFKLEKPIAEFDATVKYQLDKAVDQKSVLASLPGLHREIVIVEWTDLGEKQQERLVTFVYKKPEQKKS
jgi:prepilin-type N-terminal cleavage/methylation domain-containing protein